VIDDGRQAYDHWLTPFSHMRRGYVLMCDVQLVTCYVRTCYVRATSRPMRTA
jgi:hypothetical protein